MAHQGGYAVVDVDEEVGALLAFRGAEIETCKADSATQIAGDIGGQGRSTPTGLQFQSELESAEVSLDMVILRQLIVLHQISWIPTPEGHLTMVERHHVPNRVSHELWHQRSDVLIPLLRFLYSLGPILSIQPHLLSRLL